LKPGYADDVSDSHVNPFDHAPVPEYGNDGVDITLIRWMLSLTPAERLQFLQERIADIEAIRQLNARR
jgi:hypothetical protein